MSFANRLECRVIRGGRAEGITPERVRDRASSIVLKERRTELWKGRGERTWRRWGLGEGRRWVNEREVSRGRYEKDFGQNNDIGRMSSLGFSFQREISLRHALDNIEFSATSSENLESERGAMILILSTKISVRSRYRWMKISSLFTG